MSIFRSFQELIRNNPPAPNRFTHVSMITPKGAFYLDRTSIDELWNLCAKKINENDEEIYGIAEKSDSTLPILVDVDLKVVVKSSKKRRKIYHTSQVLKLIGFYNKVLNEKRTCFHHKLSTLPVCYKPSVPIVI